MQNSTNTSAKNKKRNREDNLSSALLDSSLESQFLNLPKKQNINISNPNISRTSELSFSGFNESDLFYLRLRNMKDLIPNSTELDMELDDSVSNNQPPSEVDQFLVEYGSRPNLDGVSNGDLMRGLLAIVKNLKSVEVKIGNLERKVTSINNQVKINSGNIAICNDNIKRYRDLALESIAGTNFNKQDKIDNQVFITGLGNQPNVKLVITELCKYYDIPRNSITSHKVIQIKDRNGQQKGSLMNMGFAEKEDQIDFLIKVNDKAAMKYVDKPVTSAQTSASSTSTAQTSASTRELRISRRLTMENRVVLGELKRLQANNQIFSIRYRNCCYQYKLTERDDFIPAPSIQHLHELF